MCVLVAEAVRALLLLVDMLPPNFLGGVDTEAAEDEAFRKSGLNPVAKQYLRAFPSSAILQIAPVSTLIYGYMMLEVPKV